MHRNHVITDLAVALNVLHPKLFDRVEYPDDNQLRQFQETVEAINYNYTDPNTAIEENH